MSITVIDIISVSGDTGRHPAKTFCISCVLSVVFFFECFFVCEGHPTETCLLGSANDPGIRALESEIRPIFKVQSGKAGPAPGRF